MPLTVLGWFPVHDHTERHEPVRVLAVAGKGELTGELVATVGRHGLARRAERVGEDVVAALVHLLDGSVTEEQSEATDAGTHLNEPARSAVNRTDVFEDAKRGHRIDLPATQALRHPQLEQPSFPDRVHRGLGKTALRFGLGSVLTQDGFD